MTIITILPKWPTKDVISISTIIITNSTQQVKLLVPSLKFVGSNSLNQKKVDKIVFPSYTIKRKRREKKITANPKRKNQSP